MWLFHSEWADKWKLFQSSSISPKAVSPLKKTDEGASVCRNQAEQSQIKYNSKSLCRYRNNRKKTVVCQQGDRSTADYDL
jgi:hypothetical protein